jgi:uncharacterized OsmC-like protein
MSSEEASNRPDSPITARQVSPRQVFARRVLDEDVPAELWVERTGRRTYTGRSSRGAQVSIGPAEAGAVFTPGELLKIALAGCVGMSVDTALSHRLGDDVAVTVRVFGAGDPEQDRYPDLYDELVVDLSGLDDDQRERLVAIVHRAVDLHCTVGRTLQHGASTHLSIAGED